MRASGVPGEPGFGSLGWGSGALICILLMTGYAEARIHRSQAWAENQFTTAESQREILNGHAEQARTRREYEAVIASYRRIVLEARLHAARNSPLPGETARHGTLRGALGGEGSYREVPGNRLAQEPVLD